METLAVWLPSLIISLIAVGSFLYLAYQSRSQIDQLRNTLRQTSEQLVEQFLQRESHNAQRYVQDAADNATGPARWLPEMRRCWLEAELAALVDHGNTRSDYQLLQMNAAPLLRIVRHASAPAADKKAWDSTETRQYLRKTRDAVASQKQFIEEFKARAATLGRKRNPSATNQVQPADESAGNGFITSMEHMESSTTELLQTIERLERELAAAQSKYDIIQDKLNALEAIRATRNATVQIAERLVANKSMATVDKADGELLVDMESAYTKSLAEMKKMGDINRQQRHLILQMEKELLLLRKDSVEQTAASAVLDKLKLQLRDYENCTTILEMESETLREQIQSLRRAIDASHGADAATAEADAANPDEQMPAPRPAGAGEQAKLHGNPLELLTSIAQAEGLEQAAAATVAWLDRQGIASVVFLKGSHEQIWTASEGRVDDHSRQLLKSMVPVAGKPISEVREGIMFIYSICRILLYGKGDFHDRSGPLQAALRDSFAAADHALQLLQDRVELRQQHRQMERIQQKIRSLLVQYNYIDAEYTRTQAEFHKELADYLATFAITDVQRNCIDTMLEDFDSQLEILSRTGKLIGNGLKASLVELSRVEQTASG